MRTAFSGPSTVVPSVTVIHALRAGGLDEIRGHLASLLAYFAGFLEQVAFANERNLIDDEIAQSMFGYYVKECWDSRAFWDNDLDRRANWDVLQRFAKKMGART